MDNHEYDEVLARRLADSLRREAEQVTPSPDAWTHFQQRRTTRRANHWRVPLIAAASVIAIAVATTAVVTSEMGGPGPVNGVDVAQTPTDRTAASEETGSATTGSGVTESAPVDPGRVTTAPTAPEPTTNGPTSGPPTFGGTVQTSPAASGSAQAGTAAPTTVPTSPAAPPEDPGDVPVVTALFTSCDGSGSVIDGAAATMPLGTQWSREQQLRVELELEQMKSINPDASTLSAPGLPMTFDADTDGGPTLVSNLRTNDAGLGTVRRQSDGSPLGFVGVSDSSLSGSSYLWGAVGPGVSAVTLSALAPAPLGELDPAFAHCKTTWTLRSSAPQAAQWATGPVHWTDLGNGWHGFVLAFSYPADIEAAAISSGNKLVERTTFHVAPITHNDTGTDASGLPIPALPRIATYTPDPAKPAGHLPLDRATLSVINECLVATTGSGQMVTLVFPDDEVTDATFPNVLRFRGKDYRAGDSISVTGARYDGLLYPDLPGGCANPAWIVSPSG